MIDYFTVSSPFPASLQEDQILGVESLPRNIRKSLLTTLLLQLLQFLQK
jgi:hypothetical protein